MSESPSRREHVSPRVSTSERGEGSDAASRTSPQSAASAASNASLSPMSPSAQQSARKLPLRPHHPYTPQLSERESIFATHYLIGENSATPRQGSPYPQHVQIALTERSSDDDAPAVQPAASQPATRPRPSDQNGAATIKRALSNAAAYSAASQPDTKQRTLSQGTGGLAPGPAANNAGGVAATRNPRPPIGEITRQRRESQGFMLKKSTSWGPSERPPQTLVSVGMEKQLSGTSHGSGKDGGAADCSSIEHSEQQIEATIAEPQQNTRSRKASHYLGLFKENTGQAEGKERAKSKESKKGRKLVRDESNEESVGLEQEKTASVEPTSPRDSRTAQGLEVAGRQAPPVVSESVDAATPTSSRMLGRASSAKTRFKEPSKAQASIEWRTGESSRGTIPLRLLEEIRSHQFPTPRHDEEHGEGSSGSPDSADGVQITVQKDQSDEDSQNILDQSADDGNDEDEEEFESDKERISAATYYPHHTPATDTALGERASPSQSASSDAGSSKRRSAHLDTVNEDAAGEGPDVESTHGVDNVAQDASRNQLSSDQDESQKSAWTPAETFSDTDYESWDDATRSEIGYSSGVTDRAEITPTATPTNHRYLHLHSRNAPLGAVELKPYKHQVGGHTKVFSFSKQAICKQLNNRENVFYEVIERCHPELLKFLPKYVWPCGCDYQAAEAEIFQASCPSIPAK